MQGLIFNMCYVFSWLHKNLVGFICWQTLFGMESYWKIVFVFLISIIFFVPHQYHKHLSCHDKIKIFYSMDGVALSVNYLAENWRGSGIIHTEYLGSGAKLFL